MFHKARLASDHLIASRISPPTHASLMVNLLGAAVVLVASTSLLAVLGGYGPAFYVISLGLGGLVLLCVLLGAGQGLSDSSFGCANTVTLTRAMMFCPLAGSLAPAEQAGTLAWVFFLMALAAFALDGVDGWVARRRGESSAFGARFDMETDGLFVLVLSLCVYDTGKAGAWVLLAGLMRYLFIGAGLLWAPLREPLGPSWRRKAICALQVGALVVCLAPIVPAGLSAWIAALGLIALSASFFCDVSALAGKAWDGRRFPMLKSERWLALRQRTTWIAALLLVLGATTLAPRALAAPAQYKIDSEHFSVGFLVHHIGYADTLGMFLKGEGSFTFDEAAPAVSDIEVTIAADSVFTNHDRRDKHLKGIDFLNVDDHPEIRFVGREARPTGDKTGEIDGDLTILGVTQPVTLQVTLNKIGDYPFGAGPPYVVGVSVRGTVKRSAFGMSYAVDNGWVGDDIEVIIEFEAIRQD